MLRPAGVLLFLAMLGLPRAAEAGVTITFLGWSADGTYYIERYVNDSLVRMVDGKQVVVASYAFVPTRPDVPPTWPKALAPYPKRPDDPNARVDASRLGADADGALAAAKALVVAPRAASTGPGGHVVSIEHTRDGDAHAIALGDRRLLLGPRIAGWQITEVFWRPDGGAVAMHVVDTGREHRGDRHVVAYDLTRYQVAGGDRKAATRARARAGRALQARHPDWEAATWALQEAVNLDPWFVDARYDLAAVAARRGDVATVQRELTWLAASTDRAAVAARRKATTDPAFERVSTREDVRARLGLGAYSSLTHEQQLIGTWTREGEGCGDPWLTLTLAAKGRATLRVRSACLPEHARAYDWTRRFSGRWTRDGQGTRATFSMRRLDDVPVSAEVRIVGCAEGSCLELVEGGRTFAPFHRGESAD